MTKIKKKNMLPQLTKALLPQRMAVSTRYIEQGNFYRETIIVKTLPSRLEDNNCLLTVLSRMQNVTVSLRLGKLSEGMAARLVDKQSNNAIANANKRKATQQIKAGEDFENITHFYKELNRDQNKIFYVNIFIEIYADTPAELKKKVESVQNTLLGSHITTEQLVYEQKEGFLAVMPFGADSLAASSNNIPSNSLASLYPFSYSAHNDPCGMLLGKTIDGGYMFLDLWNRTEQITNGSFIVLGESGRGKSYLMKKIICQQVMRGVNCYVLDPENEYVDMFKRLGGTVVNCSGGGFMINPLEVRAFKTAKDDLDGELDLSIAANTKDNSFFQHLSWLEDFMSVLIPYATGKELAGMMLLIKDMYIKEGITPETDLSKLTHRDYPTFTTLYEYVEEVLADRKKYSFYTMLSDKTVSDILLMLRSVYDGSLSPLFNGHTNISDGRNICFSIQELLSGDMKRTQACIFNLMTYIWSKIVTRREEILMAVDELHLVMNKNNLVVAKYLRDFIKRGRKYEAIVGTATQQLGDLLDDAIYTVASSLVNSPGFKFMFNCGDLDFNKISAFLSLNDGELKVIQNAKKKQCLVKAGKDKYLLNVGSLPYEEKLFGKGGGR